MTRHLSSTQRGVAGALCGALAAALLAVTVTPAYAAERVVMRLDNLRQDVAFIDSYLKRNWPHYYKPNEPLDWPELTLDRVLVGRYDVNADGRSELFVYLAYGPFCGTAGCPTHVFEGKHGEWSEIEAVSGFMALGTRSIDGAWVQVLDVWTDPASGYKSVFSTLSGLRWTGTEYVYVGEDEVLELSALIPPDLENDGDESAARDSELGHLMQYVGTRKRFHVMYDPAVRPALEALLGSEFSHLRLNMDRPSTIGYDPPYLVLKGSLRSVSDLEFGEHAILLVSADDGAVHVGIDSGGVRTIYSHAETWDWIPAPLQAWAHGREYGRLVGEEPADGVIWIGRP